MGRSSWHGHCSVLEWERDERYSGRIGREGGTPDSERALLMMNEVNDLGEYLIHGLARGTSAQANPVWYNWTVK